MSRVVCVGECMVEIAPAGDGLYRRSFAGDTFNTAWYLRRVLPPAWDVDYATCIGADEISDSMRAFMAEAGIGVAGLRRIPDRTVGLYLISLDDGERRFAYWRSASAARALAADPAWLAARLAGADAILFSGVTVAIIPPGERPALLDAVAAARAAGATIAFDPNIRPSLWPDPEAAVGALTAAAGVCDVLLPSFDDEAALFGDPDPDATVARYRAAGARMVIVKNGAGRIVAWREPEGRVVFDPPPVKAVDSTAAGDSFNAACLAALMEGASLSDALAAGARLAGRVVRSPGALVEVPAEASPAR